MQMSLAVQNDSKHHNASVRCVNAEPDVPKCEVQYFFCTCNSFMLNILPTQFACKLQNSVGTVSHATFLINYIISLIIN